MPDRDCGGSPGLSRRDALERTLGAGAALGAAGVTGGGSALAQQNESGGGNQTDGGNASAGGAQEGPDWGDWFADVDNYEGTEDLRGQDSVTVAVGAGNGLLFDPPAIWVDSGTTVTWEWTGEGGGHNVEHTDGAFQSEIVDEEGFTFEYTFEDEGLFTYFCQPHRGVGMKGGVAVGDISGQSAGGDSGEDGGGSDGLPPILPFVGAAFVVAFLSPLLFVLFLFNRGGTGGEREYGPR